MKLEGGGGGIVSLFVDPWLVDGVKPSNCLLLIDSFRLSYPELGNNFNHSRLCEEPVLGAVYHFCVVKPKTRILKLEGGSVGGRTSLLAGPRLVDSIETSDFLILLNGLGARSPHLGNILVQCRWLNRS